VGIAEQDISMMLSASEQDMVLLAKASGIPIIRLPAGSAGFLNTKMSRQQKIDLYWRGHEAVTNWMESEEGKEWITKK
jgi:hypothetical protein